MKLPKVFVLTKQPFQNVKFVPYDWELEEETTPQRQGFS